MPIAKVAVALGDIIRQAYASGEDDEFLPLIIFSHAIPIKVLQYVLSLANVL